VLSELVVGEIAGVFGVKGWVKVRSYTEPASNILAYSPWRLVSGSESRICEVSAGKAQRSGIIASLAGIAGRDEALELKGFQILVPRSVFPKLDEGCYYWSDLIGLSVRTKDGVDLGEVERLLETGANDVLVVRGERERLVPFVLGAYVLEVDRESSCITVDWDPDF
jgi:16S rRNA processing protein RimM